jgi:nitronate monooxygenase
VRGGSSPLLAATVSNAGGLGSFGANDLAPEDITKVAAEIRQLTDKPFGMNLWVSTFDPGGNTLLVFVITSTRSSDGTT